MKNYFYKIRRYFADAQTVRRANKLHAWANAQSASLEISINVRTFIGPMFTSTNVYNASNTYYIPTGTSITKRNKYDTEFTFIIDYKGDIILSKLVDSNSDMIFIKELITSTIYATKHRIELKKHFFNMLGHLSDNYPEVMSDLVLNNFVPKTEEYSNDI